MSESQQLARDRALELMGELGLQLIGRSLSDLGWNIRFDSCRRRLGACWFKSKMISLSSFHTDRMTLARIEDVIRHEIAHAIDYHIRGESDHGPEWKRVATACGAISKRTAEMPTCEFSAIARFEVRCLLCDATDYLFAKPRRLSACSSCSTDNILCIMEVVDQTTGKVIQSGGACLLKNGSVVR
jgi:predicted SprT family Zn-dependent metalloprotease